MASKDRLMELIPIFGENKVIADQYKKAVDKDNKEIKAIMEELQISEFIVDEWEAKKSVQNRESFNENDLLKILKDADINADGLIKQREYVDMDELENRLYKGELNAALLAPAQQRKRVVVLKVKKVK